MVLGMHDMFDGCKGYLQSRFSSEGALWIIMMDALFLIPVVFAAFFYPWEMLIAVAAVLLVTAILVEAVHVARTHRVGWKKHA